MIELIYQQIQTRLSGQPHEKNKTDKDKGSSVKLLPFGAGDQTLRVKNHVKSRFSGFSNATVMQ